MLVDMRARYSSDFDAKNYIHSIVNSGKENNKKRLLEYVDDELKDFIESGDDGLFDKIESYLEENAKTKCEQSAEKFNVAWDLVGDQVIRSLELIYNNTFPFNELDAYVTTIPQNPYNFEEKYFYIYANQFPKIQLRTVTHELSHFMFMYYYPELKGINKSKYGIFKEALTFFTNPESTGQPEEKELRNFYKSKSWKNIDEIIKESVVFLK